MVHPFETVIPKNARKLIVGTLPPEGAGFYFSNSTNTRLWDILTAVLQQDGTLARGSNLLTIAEKTAILEKLNLGIADIIYEYERTDYTSVQDSDIVPINYKDLLALAARNNIEEILFVYASAYKWFLHSLNGTAPVGLKRLGGTYAIGSQQACVYQGKTIKCTLLPSPLNRGRAGETLDFKLQFYRNHILK